MVHVVNNQELILICIEELQTVNVCDLRPVDKGGGGEGGRERERERESEVWAIHFFICSCMFKYYFGINNLFVICFQFVELVFLTTRSVFNIIHPL